MVTRTPHTNCTRPVWPSTGISAAPTAPPSTARTGATASVDREQTGQRRRSPRGSQHGEPEGDRHQPGVQPPGPAVAESDREGLLADLAIGRDVAEVVDHEQRACKRSCGAARDDRQRGDLCDCRIGRTGGGNQSEEHEDEELSETEVPVRLRAAGVEPSGGERSCADRQEPQRGVECDRKAGHCRQPKCHHRRSLDCAGRRQTARDETHRADPHIIGATYAVAVVVGIVHPDLQRQAHHQGCGHAPPHDAIGALADGCRSADRDGHHRGGQGSGARSGHPAVHLCAMMGQ